MYGDVSTDTIDFIRKSQVPPGKKVTYASCVYDHRPFKSEPWRVRCIVGGDKLPYTDDQSSPAASLLDTKIVISSTLSDASKGIRFLGDNLKDYFLEFLYETLRIRAHTFIHFLADIIEQYNLKNSVCSKGYIYIKIKKGICGLKYVAILAYS